MDARAKPHPTDQILSSFGLGKLDDASAESVSKHLEDCLECRKRVAEMPDDSFLGRFRGAPGMDHAMSGGSEPHGSQSATGTNAPAPPPASTLPPGLADHPDYTVKREFGRGGMGVVYLAHNKLMGRDEVLKVVSSHLLNRKGVLDRFLREIRSAAKLHHTNIVTAYSAIRPGDSLVLTMEYVEGHDLAQLVKGKGPLSVAQACNFMHQAALGLQRAHERGMVHRDIKPSNLMLAREGNKPVIKVLDFGLAKVTSEGLAESRLTHEGQMLGTPDFIAPEQIRDARSADIRADIYSLGCTLYYLLAGRPPFEGGSLWDLYQAHFSMDAGPLNLVRPEVPVELAALVAKMMAKEPERRFQTPKEVASALTPFFKKGDLPFERPVAEVSQAGQTGSGRPAPGVVSPPTQAATGAGRAAARAEKAAEPTAAEKQWESLIEFREEGRPINPAPAINAGQRSPWTKWPIAMAASLFGLIALGGIIITIRDKHGREITKIIVPDGSEVVIGGSRKKGESKPPETGTVEAADSRSPLPVAGQVGGPPAGRPTASSADPLQAGTYWKGTSTVLHRSWTNEADKPRPLWLTIKARDGAQFKAVAESSRGSQEAEGTFKDGMINWKVAKESFSWEGKLDGNELVGTFKGTVGLRDFSGEFRLTLADGPPPKVLPARVPPVGPVRGANYLEGGEWIVEGDQLIKEGLGGGVVQFGDFGWTDYDLTFRARKSAGPHGFGCAFRAGESKWYLLQIGGPGNKHYLDRWLSWERDKLIQTIPGTIQPLKWYKVKIRLRGENIRIELDDDLLFECTDDSNERGAVALNFFDSAGRFSDIKVSAPDGAVLWEGPPDLP